jgi:succinoglycan biosynthesis protein ExoM
MTDTALFKTVSVIIPTFRRPDGLQSALNSVAAQTGQGEIRLRLIVCDNSPEAAAKNLVTAFAAATNLQVSYIHEPKTGVANARNAALKAVTSDFIAFLDDDEWAPPDWLSRLLKTQVAFDADVVFGPVKALLPETVVAHRDYFEAFFSRTGPAQTGLLEGYYGCGNSLIRTDCLPRTGPVFLADRNETGGEDDYLFHGLQSSGAKMVWDAHAFVYETVPHNRAHLRYTVARAFAYGQGPSQAAASAGPKRILVCLGFMLQGLLQGLGFSLMSGFFYLISRPKAVPLFDKAVRGFGKLLWFEPFVPRFYGAAMLAKDE